MTIGTAEMKHEASKKLYRDAMFIHLLRVGFSPEKAEYILGKQSQTSF